MEVTTTSAIIWASLTVASGLPKASAQKPVGFSGGMSGIAHGTFALLLRLGVGCRMRKREVLVPMLLIVAIIVGMVFALGCVFGPIGFVAHALQSLTTRRVGPSEQGPLQGANASIAGLKGGRRPIVCLCSISSWTE